LQSTIGSFELKMKIFNKNEKPKNESEDTKFQILKSENEKFKKQKENNKMNPSFMIIIFKKVSGNH
jgi:hypothetical protein